VTCLCSLSVISGDLVLDAGGKADAVFIFRMPTTLSTSADRNVILAGGANPNNIYWSTGTAATFAARCTMQGNIFAGTAITYAAGCTHAGRSASIQVTFAVFPALLLMFLRVLDVVLANVNADIYILKTERLRWERRAP